MIPPTTTEAPVEMSKLRASVAVITYNGGRYIADQLMTIIDQTRPPDEIIVSDDASIDDTVEQARSVLTKWPGHHRVLTRSTNSGISRNLESALSVCSGDVVLPADQDDLWSPRRLERQMEVLEGNPSIDGVFCDATLVDEAGMPVGQRLWERCGFSPRLQRTWTKDPAGVLLRGTVVTGATLAFRRELLDISLPFPKSGWHDSWIALLAVFSGKTLEALAEPLLSYRLHGDNAAGLPPLTWQSRLGSYLWPKPGDLEQWTEAIERLDRERVGGNGEVVRLARARDFHAARARLSPHLLRRAGRVVTWSIGGEYRRFAAGWRTAAADLAAAALGWSS